MRHTISILVSLTVSAPVAAHTTSNDVDRVIRANAAALRACYQRELNRNPDLNRGKVEVRFTIERGRVTKAAVSKTTLNEPAVEACVVREVSKLKFPQGVEGTITYPFMFSS
jgi:hypothetical protein